MSKIKGTFVIQEGYGEKSVMLSKRGVESLGQNFEPVPIRWFGLNVEAEADGRFEPDMPICGEVFGVVINRGEEGIVDACFAIELDSKVLQGLDMGKTGLDPVFEIYDYDLHGSQKIATNLKLKGIFIRLSG